MTENIITAAEALAKESGTFAIVVSFTDENGDTLIPATLFWDLVDPDDEIINDREDVEIESPAASVTIVLSGDDLPSTENNDGTYDHLFLVVHGTFTSDLGVGLPFQDQVRFSIEAIKGDT